jgi:hypothetical protein
LRERIAGGKPLRDVWSVQGKPAQRLLAFDDDPAAAPGDQRDESEELDRVADALLGMQINSAAAKRAAIPHRLREPAARPGQRASPPTPLEVRKAPWILAAKQKQDAKRPVGIGIVWLECDRLLLGSNRFIDAPRLPEGGGKVDMAGLVVRRKPAGAVQGNDRLVERAGLAQGDSQMPQRRGKIRLDGHGTAKRGDRLPCPRGPAQGDREVHQQVWIVPLEREGPLVGGNRLVALAGKLQANRELMLGVEHLRVQRNGPPVGGNRILDLAPSLQGDAQVITGLRPFPAGGNRQAKEFLGDIMLIDLQRERSQPMKCPGVTGITAEDFPIRLLGLFQSSFAMMTSRRA